MNKAEEQRNTYCETWHAYETYRVVCRAVRFTNPCSFVQIVRTEEAVNSVSNAVIEGICPQCWLTIDGGGFQCLGPSEDYATFRATLSGTVNSFQLISYVEEWVETSPTVLVQGLRLTVDKSCPVQITSLQDPGCQFSEESTQSSGGTDNVAAVVGGVVAITTVVVITGTIVIIVVLVLKNRRAELKISQGK